MLSLRRLPHWVDALWLSCLALYIVAGAAIAPFHGDESTLMIMGRDFHYLFVEGDLSKVLYDRSWQVNPQEQRLRILNGTVSKMVYGWLQSLNGYEPSDLNRNWNWGRDYAFNLARGAIPDGELLRQARLASAIQLALAAALFFQFVKMIVNRPTAFMASALFALHPNVLINGRRAMMEGSHMLGLLLVLLAAAWLIQERRWRRYALLGVCAGFAIAAKHPNAIVCALAFLACAWRPLGQLARNHGDGLGARRRDLASIAIAAVTTILVFLLLNPAWWRDPMEVAATVVAERQQLLQSQVDWLGGYEAFGEQARGFFQYVFMGERQYYEVSHWADYSAISAQIEAYEQSWLAGLLMIGSSGRLGVICLLLAVYGVVALARDRAIVWDMRRLVLVWILGSAMATLWLTPLPWARYYLPLLPALSLLVSYALMSLTRNLLKDPYAKADGVSLLD